MPNRVGRRLICSDLEVSLTNPVPTDLAEALSPAWLEFALSERYPGISVATVTIVETIVTVATKVRFDVAYARAPKDTPRHFCLKGLFGAHTATARQSGVMNTEVRFYREVAPLLSMRLPELIYGRVAEDHSDAVLIMEDVTVAKNARFLTALTPYSPDQAAASLDQLSRLHALGWNGKGFANLPWLTSRVSFFARRRPVPPAELQTMLDGERGDALPPRIRSASRQFAAMDALVLRPPAAGQTLVHGDCHAGNVYENAEGPSIVDWQLLQHASWALDLAYHIGAVLSVEQREASERQLIDHYLDCLRAQGIDAPSRETAWVEYRAHMAYGFHLWSITRMVEPDITKEFVKRLGSAVASLGSFDLLGV